MPSLAIVTCLHRPEPDPDEPLILEAFRAAGFRTEMLAWDESNADPGAFDIVLLHSCWDYYRDPKRFLAFIDRAADASILMNSREVVRWNHHKSYLRDIADCGVPTIPTVWCRRGDTPSLSNVVDQFDWDEVVIKPTVSASSYRTRKFGRDDLAVGQGFLDDLVRDRDTMVQKFITTKSEQIETALIWIDGTFTHAVRKQPRFDGGEERTSAAMDIAAEQAAIGSRALAAAGRDVLYARVDLMTDMDGELLVSELELIEPSLFFREYPPALDRIVQSVMMLV